MLKAWRTCTVLCGPPDDGGDEEDVPEVPDNVTKINAKGRLDVRGREGSTQDVGEPGAQDATAPGVQPDCSQ